MLKVRRMDYRLTLVFADGETQVSYHPSMDAAEANGALTKADYGDELDHFTAARVVGPLAILGGAR